MHILITVVVLLCFDAASGQCIDDFIGHGTSCYHFSHDTETWIDAHLVCQSYGSECHLVEIEDATENRFLEGKVTGFTGDFWIGADDLQAEGEWRWWYSKTSVTYNNWSGGHPSNSGGNENCAEINHAGGWNDDTCHRFQSYICEMSKTAVDIIG